MNPYITHDHTQMLAHYSCYLFLLYISIYGKLKITCSRVSKFHEVVPYLFQKHNHTHLQAKIYQTATRMTLEKNDKNMAVILLFLAGSHIPTLNYTVNSKAKSHCHMHDN